MFSRSTRDYGIMPRRLPPNYPTTQRPAMLALRQCQKTVFMAATAVTGDSPLFLIDYLVRFLRVALLLSLWKLVLAGRGAVAGYSLASVLTYTVIAEVFGDQLNCRIELSDALWQGTIATRMVQPMGLVAQ